MDGSTVLIWLVVLAALGAGGAAIMDSKGRSAGVGFALGFFLGIIGVVICACMSKSMERRIEEQMMFDAAMRRINGLPGGNDEPSVEVPRRPARRMGGGPWR